MSRLQLSGPELILALVLLRTTLVLSIAWLLHGTLRRFSVRFPVYLWRFTMVGLFVMVGTTPFLSGWGFQFAERSPQNEWQTQWTHLLPAHQGPALEPVITEPVITSTADAPGSASPAATSQPAASIQNLRRGDNAQHAFAFSFAVLRERITIAACFGYIAIAGLMLLRILRQFIALRLVLRQADTAEDRIVDFVGSVSRSMGLPDPPDVMASSGISVPMTTGIHRPMILFPESLLGHLSDEQLRFVTAHECSHLQGRDLAWSLLARITQIFFWPIPLVWKLPSAHRFACDVRCDAVASKGDRPSYAKMLADLAIGLHRSLEQPFALAFLRQSEVVARVRQIGSDGFVREPNGLTKVLAGLAFTTVFVVAGTIGVNFLPLYANPDQARGRVRVTVVDPSGTPVVGAEAQVVGLRTVDESASAYGNHAMTASSATNRRGKATVEYPLFVYEQMKTGTIMLMIQHPEYAPFHQEYSVDSPIEASLTPGRRFTATAVDAKTQQRISEDLYAVLSDQTQNPAWQLHQDGTLHSPPLDPSIQSVMLVRYREGTPTLFSEPIDLTGNLVDLPMRTGETLRGVLSDRVPRPVIDGRVALTVALSSKPNAAVNRQSIDWCETTTVNPDGSFVFESIPPCSELQVVADCEGFVSATPPAAELLARIPYVTTMQHAESMQRSFTVSQVCSSEDSEPCVIEMERAATVNFQIVDPAGKPVSNAVISLSPGIVFTPGPSLIFGTYFRTPRWLTSARQALKTADSKTLSDKPFVATTDAKGQATISGIPGKDHISVSVTHPQYELPATEPNSYHRSGNFSIDPGETRGITLTVQKKGVQVLGRE
ncbi:M56 family metallopeptidase [Novipirellula artificiosorum]|uniref:Protease HtpX n=1 Tax=Novipirellula artificiosorum TaxID=2528016 RepID=A0A5C6DIP5_9BACT|nr:M56 family metallopeptidase [Novipirellula artificiosorum]TWU35964.1 Protease HtpX [Novipirellula artificiosorum]